MTDTDNLWGALLRVRSTLKAIPKTATNPHFKNTYAPLGEVLAAVLPALHSEGLALSAGLDGLILEQRVTHVDSGEFYVSRVPLIGASDMQKLGGAITYAQRYAIGALLALELEDDDDGNKAASGVSQPGRQSAPQAGQVGQGRPPATPQTRTVPEGTKGKGGGQRPAPKAQEDDADAVVFMAEQLDAKAAEDGKDFRIVKADGKLGIFGKIAERGGVPPGVYSTAQLAAKGALPKIRGFYQYLCEQNDLAVWGNASTSGVARHEAPADVASLTDDDLPF